MLFVLSTFPDAAAAGAAARALIEARLAACANLLPGVESIYRWEGAVEQATEVLVLFKTTPEAWPALRERLTALHPYETPEIAAVRAEDVAAAYAAWVRKCVQAP